MPLPRHHGGWVILLSFMAAYLLTVMPMPREWAWLRPEWTALVLIYWCLAVPQRVGVAVGWLAGLFQDVLRGALLGQYALGLAVVAYLTLKLHRRLRLFPLWQQALSVLVLVALQQLLVLWVQGILGQARPAWAYWLPAATSALLWPPLFLLLRALRRRFRVS